MLHGGNLSGDPRLLSRRKGQRRVVRGLLAALFSLVSILAMGIVGPVSALAAQAGPDLTVNVDINRHAISRDIYGMNTFGDDPALAAELHIPVQRRGGDATSRYNWQVDSSNSGGDWFFMGGDGNSNPVPSASVDAFISNNKADGSKTVLTIPVIDYINKTSDWNCSFPVSIYGPQQSVNPYIHPNGEDCGNGVDLNGNNITDTNILLNNIPNSADFQKGWIQHLIQTFGKAKAGGVQIYQMDNEPSGWGNTHRDIHPGPTGYDELINKTIPYASMIKQLDSHAAILGPSDFGYPAYIGMGAPGDDATSHGVGFAEYYLQQMHKYQQQHDVRLLDYFDEHYYPSSGDTCLALCPAGDANTQAERLQSTRTLWDPTYKDTSWIGTYFPPIQWIRWFRSLIAKDYPGTKLAMTEYNFGGLESINGALTQADVLGIFGREQLDLATLWGPPTSSQPGAYAFRMFLNYDGKGSAFGDTSVQSLSTDQSQLAVYGAQRSSDKAVTLMIINKTGNDLTSNLALSGYNPDSTAQVYSYSSANLNAIVQQPDIQVSSNGFSATYPANSITMVVLSPSKVHPVLECVGHNGSTYTAYFGYLNPNSFNVTIPVGPNNNFTPNPKGRAQTTEFLPGRRTSVFGVSFNANATLVWNLNGHTSTASSSSPPC